MTLHDYKLACPSYQMLDHGSLCDACVTGGPLQAARRRCKDGSLSASALLSIESSLHRLTRAYAPVDVFVCPSQFLAGVMRAAGVYPDRLHVVNHFVVPDAGGSLPPAEPGSVRLRRPAQPREGRRHPRAGGGAAARSRSSRRRR